MRTSYTADYYNTARAGSRRSAEIVVPLLLELIRPRSVIDVGCGIGTWLGVFRDHGIDDILGVDGDYVKRTMLQIPSDRFLPHDLRRPLHLDRKFDLAVCVEVAEHLPPECADTLVSSLVRFASVILFSAAIPHQGGADHVNEQWPEYWVEFFRRHDFVVTDPIRRKVWDNPETEWWYAQNLLTFVEASRLADYPRLLKVETGLSFVHPRNGLLRVKPKRYGRFRPAVRRRLRRLLTRVCSSPQRP